MNLNSLLRNTLLNDKILMGIMCELQDSQPNQTFFKALFFVGINYHRQ